MMAWRTSAFASLERIEPVQTLGSWTQACSMVNMLSIKSWERTRMASLREIAGITSFSYSGKLSLQTGLAYTSQAHPLRNSWETRTLDLSLKDAITLRASSCSFLRSASLWRATSSRLSCGLELSRMPRSQTSRSCSKTLPKNPQAASLPSTSKLSVWLMRASNWNQPQFVELKLIQNLPHLTSS